MTVTERDLFLAILSMDAYNRGYGAGLNDSGVGDANGLGGVGSAIGTATVTRQSDTEAGSAGVAAGFYAVAYQTQWGTVISYRGTDFTAAGDLARNTRTTALRPGLGAGRGQRLIAGGERNGSSARFMGQPLPRRFCWLTVF